MVGEMTIKNEVGEVISRRIASTAVHNDSDLISMMKDVMIKPIVKKMNTRLRLSRNTSVS